MANKLPAHEIAKKALKYYVHRNEYAYLYGTDGQIGSDELVDKMVARHINHFCRYSEQEIHDLKDYVRGKICFDCSGFIHTLFGAPDMNSFGIISSCTRIYQIPEEVTESPEATVLWKPGHVGIDVGHGFFVDIASEFDTFRFLNIREYGTWKQAGEWTDYSDYTDAKNY